jgi:hypothetical protein
MKKYIIKDPTKFTVKKRVLVINVLLFTIIMSFLVAGCIKENYPVRLVFPVLTTANDTTAVTATSILSGGNITADGGYDITARGICLSVKMNPSIALDTLGVPVDTITVDGAGTGIYTSTVNGLVTGKAYHIRAYATNSQGTTYGQDVLFKTHAK